MANQKDAPPTRTTPLYAVDEPATGAKCNVVCPPPPPSILALGFPLAAPLPPPAVFSSAEKSKPLHLPLAVRTW